MYCQYCGSQLTDAHVCRLSSGAGGATLQSVLKPAGMARRIKWKADTGELTEEWLESQLSSWLTYQPTNRVTVSKEHDHG